MQETIRFEINNQSKELVLEQDRSLLWVLRNNLTLTGTKYGCGMGHCGSCTVLIDNKPFQSCQVTADFINGKKVTTIEGLERNGLMHPVQKSFIQHDALQCGYCTPGMIITATGLLYENPAPTRDEIIGAMENNFCRCGTYSRIVDAIQSASKEMKGGI